MADKTVIIITIIICLAMTVLYAISLLKTMAEGEKAKEEKEMHKAKREPQIRCPGHKPTGKADLEIKNENEHYRMRVAELEKTEIAFHKIMDIMNNAKQWYGDVRWSNAGNATGIMASNKWDAIDDLQHEIEEMLE
ncbi:hypothetical protein [Lacrimispora sp.]|uniref:hypothetical protein n=1 Tax=Lacrimispora sp. TaxID=2719234 RepID=UPI0028B22556|nr:hypothetical protein [Lacrimispora sp.]